MKNIFLLFINLITLNILTAQLSLVTNGVSHSITFDATTANVNNGTYTSAAGGVSNTPVAGQLDTDAWEFIGLSAGDVLFGGSSGSSDYRRGTSSGGVSTGGLYAFDVDNGGAVDRALGIQTTGSDMTPGSITLKAQNNTGAIITSLTIDYEVHEYNDKSNAIFVTFSHSQNNLVFNNELALDVGTPTASTGGSWVVNSKSVTISNLNIPISGNYFFKWHIHNNSGTTSRDEIALDNIVITPSSAGCALAIEPTIASSNISTRLTTCDGTQIFWDNGDGSNRIVVLSTNPIVGTPSDLIKYDAIAYYGQTTTLNAGEYIVYNGTNNVFNLAGLSATTTYHIAVFEYNGSGCGENYFNTSGTTSFTTSTCSICPQITSVLVDGCNNSGTCTNEGEGEFVMMRNGDHYLPIRRNEELVNTNILYYSTSFPASTTFTDQYTSNTTLINDLNSIAGCTVFKNALEVEVIEVNANMLFIKDNFCTDSYDFSSFCGRTIYVFMSVDRSWSIGGSFKNYSAAPGTRHFRTDFSGLVLDGTCTTTDYAFEPSLLSGQTDGDYVLYDGSQNATYGNGCNPTNAPLPINLLNFNAHYNNRKVSTYWTTVSELENDYFTVERSRDGIFFNEIGIIQGAGNSSIELNYQFTDKTPFKGISYYRLKQTDYNGSVSYSEIRSILIDKNGLEIIVLESEFYVLSKNYPVQIGVYDLGGKLINNSTLNSKDDRIEFNVAMGMYIISASNQKENVKLKVIK